MTIPVLSAIHSSNSTCFRKVGTMLSLVSLCWTVATISRFPMIMSVNLSTRTLHIPSPIYLRISF